MRDHRGAPAPAHAPAIDLDYLIFECLGERTVALAQQARAADPDAGYDPLLEHRLRAVLPACRRKGTRIITNMGAANPMAAARAAVAIARELGASGLRIAVVSGDDVPERIGGGDHALAIGAHWPDWATRLSPPLLYRRAPHRRGAASRR